MLFNFLYIVNLMLSFFNKSYWSFVENYRLDIFFTLWTFIITLQLKCIRIFGFVKMNEVSQLSCDRPRAWQFWFQDPATINMEGVIDFHHDLTYIIVILSIFVGYIIVLSVYTSNVKSSVYTSAPLGHYPSLEIIWTIIPAFILMLIATPSFALLYSIDEVVDPVITLKAIGHQWYWHYEYTNKSFGNKIYSQEMRLVENGLRLLDTDRRVVLPTRVSTRLVVTSEDVLHSWTVPSFGIKIDACPGRLNMVNFTIKRTGLFYGQCSEICGIMHSAMPITVTSASLSNWTRLLEFSSTISNPVSIGPTGSCSLAMYHSYLNNVYVNPMFAEKWYFHTILEFFLNSGDLPAVSALEAWWIFFEQFRAGFVQDFFVMTYFLTKKQVSLNSVFPVVTYTRGGPIFDASVLDKKSFNFLNSVGFSEKTYKSCSDSLLTRFKYRGLGLSDTLVGKYEKSFSDYNQYFAGKFFLKKAEGAFFNVNDLCFGTYLSCSTDPVLAQASAVFNYRSDHLRTKKAKFSELLNLLVLYSPNHMAGLGRDLDTHYTELVRSNFFDLFFLLEANLKLKRFYLKNIQDSFEFGSFVRRVLPSFYSLFFLKYFEGFRVFFFFF